MAISRLTKIAAGLAVTALALTACGAGAKDTKDAQSGQSGQSGAAGSNTGRSVEEIKEAGVVRIGVFSDKAPFGSVNADGEYEGYDIEYGERIGEDLGVDVEWVPVEAAARVEFLESDKVDIILANFTVTEERSEKVDFAKPYMQVALGVVSPEDDPITAEDQLADAKLIVVRGTTAEPYLEKSFPENKPEVYEQYAEATNALLDGRGNAWVTDNTEALAWAKNNPGFTAGITSLGTPDFIAAAVKKGNTSLLDWLNDNLVQLGGEEFFHGAYEKTLLPVYGDDVSADELVVEGGEPAQSGK